MLHIILVNRWITYREVCTLVPSHGMKHTLYTFKSVFENAIRVNVWRFALSLMWTHLSEHIGVCIIKLKLNSVAVVRKRTIPTERPPLVGEVSANLYGQRVLRGQRNEFPRPLISRFSRPEPLLFHSSSSSIVLRRLSVPRSRPPTSQKI
jgi:hypothetical protein